MNMKKMIQTLAKIEKGKSTLKESSAVECGDMGSTDNMSSMGNMQSMPQAIPAQSQGNPVTASLTLNASGMDHVSDLMRLMQQAGLEKAGPPEQQPLPMRQDMEGLRDKMNSLEKPQIQMSLSDDDVREWDNEPDEDYQDHHYMLDDLAGGINKPKQMFKPAAKGDNPMALESIKERLYRALAEKKSKPDFLDVDGDGDRKEPMTKALADKKKKSKKKIH
jgi:hypothetical protein